MQQTKWAIQAPKLEMPDTPTRGACRRPELHRRDRYALPGEAPAKMPRGARTRSPGPHGPSQYWVVWGVLRGGDGRTRDSSPVGARAADAADARRRPRVDEADDRTEARQEAAQGRAHGRATTAVSVCSLEPLALAIAVARAAGVS